MITLVSPFVWFLAGLAAPKVYEKLSNETKASWKEKYPFHHGEIGVLMVLGGIFSKNYGLSAFGAGLAVDDWKDKNDWFKKIEKEQANEEQLLKDMVN